jgi:hypothetical protein
MQDIIREDQLDYADALVDEIAKKAWDDYADLPPLRESWRNLIPDDIRTVGRWAVTAVRSMQSVGDTVLAIGVNGAHTGAGPGRHVQPEAYSARHSAGVQRGYTGIHRGPEHDVTVAATAVVQEVAAVAVHSVLIDA